MEALGGDLGFLEVGRQDGGAGVTAVVSAVGVDDDGGSGFLSAFEGGGDDLGAQNTLAIVFEDDGVGLGAGGAGGFGEAVEDGALG